MRKLIGSAVLVTVLAVAPTLASAQRRPAARPAATRAQRPSFGAQLDWGGDTDFGIGGRVVVGLRALFPKTPLDGIASFDYFFPSHPSGTTAHYWEINGNVVYRIPHVRSRTFAPYVGGGLNIAHASASAGTLSASDTKAGLNLLGGTTFKVKGEITPFAELRGIVGGGKQVVITGGIRF